MKLIHQGGLHNHGNNDTHTCSVPIETRSRSNLTVYDCSNWVYCASWLKRTHHIKIMFLNRIDNLHNHDNIIILIVIFLIRIYTVQKLGNALITQFSDIIERIKNNGSRDTHKTARVMLKILTMNLFL